jgi:hypothetical protein
MNRLMPFDARRDHTPEQKTAFVDWLVAETVQMFKKSAGDAEGLKSCVFLAVNRAHDAGLTSKETAQIIGVSSARSGLSPQDESAAFDWLEEFDPIAVAVHDRVEVPRPWWKFWP